MKRHGILRPHNIPRIWGSKSLCPMTKSIANVHLPTHSQLTGYANIAKALDWTPRLQFARVWLKPLICLYTSGKQASSFATLDQCRGGGGQIPQACGAGPGGRGGSQGGRCAKGSQCLQRGAIAFQTPVYTRLFLVGWNIVLRNFCRIKTLWKGEDLPYKGILLTPCREQPTCPPSPSHLVRLRLQ